MTVEVGINGSNVSLANWLSSYHFGRHMEWPVTSSGATHMYSSMLSAFVENTG